VENNVADALSQDNDLSDKELTKIFRTHCPSQIPQHFKIVPVPSKIVSWLTSLLPAAVLLCLPVKQQMAEKHLRMKLWRGADTPNGANNQVLATTCSSTDFPNNTKLKSWALLLWLFIKGDF
jgi:hypothetical protein